MLISYSRDNSIAEAIEMTFDGENPCPLCLKIKEAQTSSTKDTQLTGLPASKLRDLWGFSNQRLAFGPPTFTFQPLNPSRCRCPQDVIFPPPNQPPISA